MTNADGADMVRRRRIGEAVAGFAPLELRRLRKARGLTLDALGQQASATRSSLIAYEKGLRRPGTHTLRALAATLGCEPAALTGSGPGSPSLADLRIGAGVTKTELAARLGVARRTWDQIEQGTRPLGPELVPRVARCLKADRRTVRSAGRTVQAAPAAPTAVGAEGSPPVQARLTMSDAPGRLERQFADEPFVGRDEEIAELRGLLPDLTLLTLTGTPGVGKTRLAVQLSRRAAGDYADGAWLVELAGTRDEDLVPQAVATAFGVREQRRCSLTDTLCSRLANARLLLLLDNCEHLVGACSALVERLLDACPGVTLLVTSQRPLGVASERAWAVPAMAVPGADEPPEAAGGSEAVRLFCEMAAANRRGFSLTPRIAPAVAEICRRLEGIPLAIQLAAARIAVLTPAEILERLDDPFSLLVGGVGAARHRTLHAALDWSHELLPTAERLLLRRMSVFVGGCGIDAVEWVCGGFPDVDGSVLDPLAALLAKSLVISDTSGDRSRYRLLESIREYAAARAEEAGETAAIRSRHLDWCVALAEESEIGLTSAEQVAWLERMEGEHDNLRTALRWTTGQGDADAALRLSGALTHFWRLRGYFREGRGWLQVALELQGPAEPSHRAKALRGMGFLSLMLHETAMALPALERALRLSRECGDVQCEARSLLLLGNAIAMSEPIEAVPLFERSAALARQLGDHWCLGHALAMDAIFLISRGDVESALSLLDECLVTARAAGELQSLQMALHLLGTVARRRGDLDAAETLFTEGLGITRQLGEPFDTGIALQWLGEIAAARGAPIPARELLGEALSLARLTGDPGSICRALTALGSLELSDGDLPAAQGHFDESASTAAGAGMPPVPDAREGLGEIAVSRGDTARGKALLEEALELGRALGDRVVVARSIMALGGLNRRRGRVRMAAKQLREALRLRAEVADGPGTAESLEALARLAVDCARWQDAAHLLGAAQGIRDRGGYARPRSLEADHDETRKAVESARGPRAFAVAWERGRAMSTDEAVAGAQGAGGMPGRPPLGWPSLTRAESGVADLVVEGLTNTQIASRLFVTRSTVEGHLTSIFGKLGLQSRSQLVREGLRRELADER